jgi:hypothetical protein
MRDQEVTRDDGTGHSARQWSHGGRGKYPAWHIWMSQARQWWATRKGPITPSRNRDCRWSMTVDAGTSEDLDKQLEEQSALG